MAEAASPGTTRIAAISTDQDMDIDFKIDEVPPRIVPRSMILESIASNHGDDFAAMQKLYRDLEESKYNAFLRDSALGLILNKKYQEALSHLEEMEPRLQDRLYETFLMLECELHLEKEFHKHLDRCETLLFLSMDIECKEILQWGNNLASTKSPLMGWMYLFDIARIKKQLDSLDINEYAEWILTPTHEFGLNFHFMLLYMDQYHKAAKKVLGVTLEKWRTSIRHISDKSRKYMAEFQIETSISLCKCMLDTDFTQFPRLYARESEFKPPEFEDKKLNAQSVHKVYCFALIAATAAAILHERADVGTMEQAKRFWQKAGMACSTALDFVSEEDRKAAIDIIFKLLLDAREEL